MNIAEAKAKLSELVARAEAGEEVVIARDGAPVVKLAAIFTGKHPVPGQWAHLGPLSDAALRELEAPGLTDAELEEMENEPLLPKPFG